MRSNPQKSGGFTLIELLTSMAIGTIILLAAASLLGSSGDGYQRVGGTVATEREARALISQLAADLATARFHKDGVMETSTKAWPADRLGFLSLQPSQAQTENGRIGDLCAVHYYIDDLIIGGKTVRCLMRGFRESSDTFKTLGNDAIPSLFIKRDNIDEPIAFGVVSFQARPISRDAQGNWIDWVQNGVIGPEAFDVRLVIARRDLAGRLQSAADWNGGKPLGNPAEADRNADLEVYGARIRFGNHETL